MTRPVFSSAPPAIRRLNQPRPAVRMSPRQRSERATVAEWIAETKAHWETVACWCGGTVDSPLASHDRYGLPNPTQLCMDCGTLRTSPRMPEADLHRFYQQHYRALYSGSSSSSEDHLASYYRKGERILGELLAAGLSRGAHTIEIGAGNGAAVTAFQDQGMKAQGLDLDAKYSRGAVSTFDGDYRAAVLGSDAVVMSHVLEHLPDPLKALKAIREGMAEEALLYVEVPIVEDVPLLYGGFHRYLQGAHLWSFSRSSLNGLIAKAGFQSVRQGAPGWIIAKPGADKPHFDPSASRRMLRQDRWKRPLWAPLWAANKRLGKHPKHLLGDALVAIFGQSTYERIKRTFTNKDKGVNHA